jgi:UPF0716 protein FxsA
LGEFYLLWPSEPDPKGIDAMGRMIFLVFLGMPLIEIALFIVIGQTIGLWLTLLGVVLSALVGIAVIRWQGVALLGRFRETMGRRQMPARSIADAMLVCLAGFLLLVPGYFSDFIAVLLLIPPVRELIYKALTSRMTVVSTGFSTSDPGEPSRIPRPDVIDLDSDDYRQR